METASIARIGERLAHVFEFLGLFAGVLQQRRLGLFARRLIDIAEPGDARIGQPE